MAYPTVSLCMIVAPTPEEAKLLDRALWSIKNEVDEMCITITGECEEVEKVCQFYGAAISKFEWTDDFAAARNFNFSQSTCDYIIWLDADDVLVGAKNLGRICKSLRQNKVEGVAAWYLYHFDKDGYCDVKHRKTRIIKNEPGLWTWGKEVCELHEDLVASRQVTIVALDENDQKNYLEVHHLTNDERIDKNKERNLRIATAQVEKYPEDPRAYWNLANSQTSKGMSDEAMKSFEAFLKRSQSPEERYIALHRMAMMELEKGNHEACRTLEYRALELFPWFPDAWIGLGVSYHKEQKYRHAAELLIQGMAKKMPDNMLVFDPQGYVHHPMRLLADCYFNLGMAKDAKRVIDKVVEMYPKSEEDKKMQEVLSASVESQEKVEDFLKKSEKMTLPELAVALAALPEDMQAHPGVCVVRNDNFYRKETTGKNIDYFCGYTHEQWDRDSEATGIGGSEEAVLNLTREWAKAGHVVTVYNNCGPVEKVDEYGVTWKPYHMFNPRDKFDTLILWRHPKLADHVFNVRQLLVDMHDVLSPQEFTKDRLNRIDKVYVKSKYHRSLYANIPDDKVVVLSNGINLAQFDGSVARHPARIIYTSSPDRGLEHLLERWGEVRKRVPEAELHVFYGWGVYDSVHADNPLKMQWKERMIHLMNQTGIFQRGRVGHDQIAKEMMASDVFAYPCHFEEIDCISVKKAIAAGCTLATTDYAALGEYKDAPAIHKGDWDGYTKMLIERLEKPVTASENPLRWSWERIAKGWEV